MKLAMRALLAALLALTACPAARAYSVMAHEAIIDAAWNDSIRPLLLKRFPDITAGEIQQAQAYGYGGAIIQDMGYYPFGNKFFSNLTHYVRSGEFVLNLLGDAQDVKELAFALGALAHYVADSYGHPQATNRVVPIMYPKLKEKFGPVVTYEDSPAAHLKVEFSFDVVQLAQGDYAPQAYHDHIGFEVAQRALEQAFAQTYSLELTDVFFDEELSIGTYRFAISSVIPTMTKVAWSLKKDEIQKARPGLTRRQFLYRLSRSEYRKTWGKAYERPGPGARLLAFLIRILPKIGPLRALTFPAPPQPAETLFMRSFNETLDEYRRLVAAYDRGELRLPDDNFDTGGPVRPGAYRLTDESYARLLNVLSGKVVSAQLRANILAFYADPSLPFSTRKKRKAWEKVLSEVNALKAGRLEAPR